MLTHGWQKASLKWAWSGYVNHLHFGNHQPYLWNGRSYNRQILYTGSLSQAPAYGWQITLKRDMVMVTWPILNFAPPNDISRTVEAIVVKFRHFARKYTIRLHMNRKTPLFCNFNYIWNYKTRGLSFRKRRTSQRQMWFLLSRRYACAVFAVIACPSVLSGGRIRVVIDIELWR